MHSLKIHRSYRSVVAICDLELLGKRFEEGNRQLDIRENFYKDQEISTEDLIKIIKRQRVEDASFNIIGEKSVQAALETEIITNDSIGKVNNIPFALTLL